MSIEAVAEFTKKLAEDESLQQELQSAIEGKEGLDASQAVSELGAKHSYEFTAEEAQYTREFILESKSDELSEEQLEAVAGGGDTGKKIGGAIGSFVEDYGPKIVKSIFKGW
jgi:predicted ribosomally synthesized peptide with nif11-like leader